MSPLEQVENDPHVDRFYGESFDTEYPAPFWYRKIARHRGEKLVTICQFSEDSIPATTAEVTKMLGMMDQMCDEEIQRAIEEVDKEGASDADSRNS